MATNYVQPGEVLTLTAPYDRLSGQGMVVGGIFAIALYDALSGAEVEGQTTGVWTLAKTNAQEWAVGDRIYWNASTKAISNLPGDGMFIGVATAAAANPSSTGTVRLNPAIAEFGEGAQAAIASLTFGTNITAATANNSLTDSSATNPTEAQFNELAKELGTKINDILVALRAAGIIAT